VRKAQLVDTDTESEPEEAPSEAEESQPLGSRVPIMGEEFETSEPSGTRIVSSHSFVSLDFTASFSPDHPLTHASPTSTPTRVSFHHRTARMARYRSSYETPPPSSSLTLLLWKRYRGTSELIEDTEGESSEPDSEREGSEDESSDSDDERKGCGLDDEGQGLDDEGHSLDDEGQGLEDEGPSMEEEEAAPEGQQQTAPFRGVTFSQRYRFRSLEREHERATVTFSAIWRLVLALDAWAGQTDAQRGALWHAIYDIQRENHDLRRQLVEERREQLEQTDRAPFGGVTFSQRYRFRSLKREHERATVTFSAIWRLRENHDLRRRLVEERREQLEQTDRVARMERRHESGGE
nr:hypothetical protein [Tanacetum cinerariifolium]